RLEREAETGPARKHAPRLACAVVFARRTVDRVQRTGRRWAGRARPRGRRLLGLVLLGGGFGLCFDGPRFAQLRRRRARRRRRGAAPRPRGRLGGSDYRLRDTADRVLSEPCRPEQLLGTLLRPVDDRGSLAARPLERLLDLGASGIRQLGRL